MMRRSIFVSDAAWESLIQMAYDCSYVRGKGADDRPRGLSAFVGMLSWQKFEDTRPEYLRGTGQWVTGLEHFKQRCLVLSPGVIAALGYIALEHGIYPFRSQLPVANGFRKTARVPILYAIGATPTGSAGVTALIGPVLDAIGVGHLSPVVKLPQAPPDLYALPSKKYKQRREGAAAKRTVM